MFPKREIEVNFDIIIGRHSLIKGDIESEGSIRIDGKIIGNITSLGNVIVSENAFVNGSITCQSVELYGSAQGDVNVKGKINLHQNASLIGNVLAKSFSTKEGALFKGSCVVDPLEELTIVLDTMIQSTTDNFSHKLLDFSKGNKQNDKNYDKSANNEKENKAAK